MNISILHSWLTDYLKTNAQPADISKALALSGPSVEKLEKFGDNDWLYDIEVTTNRVDMMSVYGIAREAAACLPQFGFKATLQPLNLNEKQIIGKVPGKVLPLTVKTDKHLTYRVMAMVMEISQVGPSPEWLRKRLEAAGIRSLNNVIDITNYVMTEIGHPTHVFDYDRINSHHLIFRQSKRHEKVTTLDEKTHILPGDDLVIDDGSGLIIDLPGIMGTANSVVTDKTKRIIFFIDNDNPVALRKTSMSLGIRTIAATLGEKKVDPNLGLTAMLRGIQLYKEICQAQVANKLIDIKTFENTPREIIIALQFIEDRLGVKVDPDFVKKTLVTLGFEVKVNTSKQNKAGIGHSSFTITVPTWRLHDITIPEDIVEEIARIYGYHNLPSLIPTGEFPLPSPQDNLFYWEDVTKNALKYWGIYESYSYSLISKETIEKWGDKPNTYLKLKNPLSTDWEILRKSLLPSLLQIVEHNQDKEEKASFFELANTYYPNDKDLPEEILTLSLAVNSDEFLRVKGIIESLGKEWGISLEWQEDNSRPQLNPGKQAKIVLGKEQIGVIGVITPAIQSAFNLKNPVTLVSLNFQKIVREASKDKHYQPVPKYPPILEQYTFFNRSRVPAAELLKASRDVNAFIREVQISDVFGDKLSLEVSYINPEHNLTDSEIAPIRRKLIKSIENLGLKLQGEV